MEVKLLDRVRGAIRARHYSRRTESAYVYWIRRYIVFHQKKHPAVMGASEVTAFLTWLAVHQRVSASTQNQALSAVLFLYRDVLTIELGQIESVPRARVPGHVPVVLSRDEVRHILARLSGASWLVVSLLYGAGLRLLECLELRVKDVDVEGSQLIVRRGKGRKDRRTVLPTSVKGLLVAHLDTVKRQHEQDVAAGVGRSCCRTRSSASTRMPGRHGRGSSCFQPGVCAAIRGGGRRRAITCTSQSCSAPSRKQRGRRASPNALVATLSGIHSRRTCSKMAATFGRCRNSSATPTSARR